MISGAVERVCVEIETGFDCGACEVAGAESEFSLLSPPTLRTLFGRLTLPDGEPAPPGPVEPGLLSPTRFLINSSNSLRSVPLGVGDMSCCNQLCFHSGEPPYIA